MVGDSTWQGTAKIQKIQSQSHTSMLPKGSNTNPMCL